MCPLCLGTASLLVSGTTSVSGLTLVLLRKQFRKPHTKTLLQVPPGAEDPGVPANGARATANSSAYRSVRKL
jgi:hypothetical protein